VTHTNTQRCCPGDLQLRSFRAHAGTPAHQTGSENPSAAAADTVALAGSNHAGKCGHPYTVQAGQAVHMVAETHNHAGRPGAYSMPRR
jgi:hypothetical protein